jgi:drug/metabolite transporter (DMT)-like permease
VSRRGLQLFAAMSLAWGVPYLFIRIAVAGMPPAAVILGRSFVAWAILLPIALHGRGLGRVMRRWRPLLAFTLLEMALPWYLITTAEETATSSFSGLMIAAVPLLAAIIAIARGDRAVRPVGLAGLVIGFAGVATLGGTDFHGASAAVTLELLAAALCYAVGPMVLERHLSDLPGPAVMTVALTGCAAIYLALALRAPISMPSGASLLAILVLGVVCTAFAFVAYSALITEIGSVRAVVITYVNPALALALGVIVLHETLSLRVLAALALVLIGSALAAHEPAAPNAMSAAADSNVRDPMVVGRRGEPGLTA